MPRPTNPTPKSGEIDPKEPLSAVLPVVIYNGDDPWTAKTDLADMIYPSLPGQLMRWQPQIRYLPVGGQPAIGSG